MKIARFIAWLCPILFFFHTSLALADEVVTLNTRPGVKQSILILEPKGPIKGVVLMFPGHEGVVKFEKSEDGFRVIAKGGGLTAKKAAREVYRQNGLVAAVVAPATGMEAGLDTEMRSSGEHTEDIRKVIAFLTGKYGVKPFLHGHCRSSFSPAAIVTHLENAGIAGMILTSPRSRGRWGKVMDYKSDVVKVPVLLVQHMDDKCPGTPPHLINRVKRFYENSSSKVNLIKVSGGISKGTTDTCQNGYHAFKGLEEPVVAAISAWILGKEFPHNIHD